MKFLRIETVNSNKPYVLSEEQIQDITMEEFQRYFMYLSSTGKEVSRALKLTYLHSENTGTINVSTSLPVYINFKKTVVFNANNIVSVEIEEQEVK